MSWFRRHRALLILFGAAFVWNAWGAYVDSARDRDRGWQVVRSWTGPDATEAQLRPLFEDCHDDALEFAFDQGGRRSMWRVEDLYFERLFDRMEQRARATGDAALAEAVNDIHEDILAVETYPGMPRYVAARRPPEASRPAAGSKDGPASD